MSVERRRYMRVPIDVVFEIDKVYRQNYEIIEDLEADIEVVDISRAGLGFYSNKDLPIGYYFHGTIGLGGKEFFRAVLKIVRKTTDEEGMNYGAEFVGLAPFLVKKVEDYEKNIQSKSI